MSQSSWFWLESVVAATGVTLAAVSFYMRRTVHCASQRELPGRVAIVTGANSGIGLEVARGLARRRTRVILACRNEDRGEAVAKDIRDSTGWEDVVVRKLDLASFKSVRTFAHRILEEESRLDVLVNNAASVPRQAELTEDGLDVQFQTNYLGPFLLTRLLMPLLEKSAPSRVVNVSSVLYKVGRLRPEDEDFGRAPEPWLATYAATKLALVLFTRELARRLESGPRRVLVVSCTPGTTSTNIARHAPWLVRHTVGLLASYLLFRTAEQGAQTPLYLAVAEELEDRWPAGKYFVDCAPEPFAGAAAQGDELAKQLWDSSEALTGLVGIVQQGQIAPYRT